MIRLIAAIDRKRGIAKHGFQPWSIPDDEQYFTKQTKSNGACVLIGNSTFKIFKNPLADRQNFVLSRDELNMKGVVRVHDLKEFLDELGDKDMWVAGGASVYAQVIDLGKADELYITHIDADFACDQFFPDFEDKFTKIEEGETQEQSGFKFTYTKYAKKS